MKISLLDNHGNIQTKAGLNWGSNRKNHTTKYDSYIAIRARHIKRDDNFFMPRVSPNPIQKIVWDDGTKMNGLLEGVYTLNGVKYPKQFSSKPRKKELGNYFRKRMGLLPGAFVTKQDLEKYGRTDVDITLKPDGSYYIDFSV